MSAPHRILYVEANENGTVGGSHRCLVDIVRHIDRRRFEPVVLFYQSNPHADALRAEGVEVVTWDGERAAETGGGVLPRKLHSVARLAGAIARRRAFLRERRIALLHLNNSPVIGHRDWLPAALVARVPVVSHARGHLDPRASDRALMRRFTRIIAISDHVRRDLLAAGVPGHRVVRIHDGIDLADLRQRAGTAPAEAVRRAIGVEPHEHLVVMVGHLWTWKGQDIVLEAVARMPERLRSCVRVALAGGTAPTSAAFRERLDELAALPELTGRVSFLGPRSDAPALMRAADVVVHASRLAEPFGLVVVEAMALGRPVIASKLGGPAEVVTDGTGHLFDPEHPEELAAALERLLSERPLRERLAAAAQQRAAAFDIGPAVRAIEAVYDEVLATGSRA